LLINILLFLGIFVFAILTVFVEIFFKFQGILGFVFFIVIYTVLIKKYKMISIDRAIEYFILSLTSIALLFSVVMISLYVSTSPFWKWNSMRLAWALSPFFGYKIYYAVGQGPLLARMYGPVSLFFYAPAIFGRIPSISIIIGSAISALLYFSPVVFLIIDKIKERKKDLIIILQALACFCLFSTYFRPLRYSALSVHVDASAVGFGALACIFIYIYRPGKKHWPLWIASSICCILSILSKQTMVPLVVAIPAYIIVAHKKEFLRDYILCLMGSAIVAFLMLAAFFDLKLLFFDMFVIPSRQPFVVAEIVDLRSSIESFKSGFLILFALLFFFLSFHASVLKREENNYENRLGYKKNLCAIVSFVFILPIAVFLVLKLEIIASLFSVPKQSLLFLFSLYYLFLILGCFFARKFDRLREAFSSHRWIIFLISSSAIFLTSTLALFKVGGDSNNVALSVYLLLLCVAIVFIEFMSCAIKAKPLIFKRGVALFLMLITLILIRQSCREVPLLVFKVKNLKANAHDLAYRYALKNPGKTYFPDLLLSNLFADKKLYHSLDGITDRFMGKFLIDPDVFKKDIPEEIEMVIFAPNHGDPIFYIQDLKEHHYDLSSLNDYNLEYLFFLAESLYSLKYYKKSLIYYRKISEKKKKDAWVQMRIGECQRFLKSYNSAAQSYKESIRLNPQLYQARIELGRIYLLNKKYKKAIQCFYRAHKIDPHNREFLEFLGDSYFASNNYNKALFYYKKLSNTNKNCINKRCWNKIADSYVSLKDYENAEYYYHEYLKHYPENLSAWKGLFRVCLDLGKTKKALFCLEEIIRQEPMHKDYWVQRKQLYKDVGLKNFSFDRSLGFPMINAFFNKKGKYLDVFVYLMSFFPEYERLEVSDLPGFVVFKKEHVDD